MLTANENLGRLLALGFQPVAPLLSLLFVFLLIRRKLSTYWSVVAYFFILSLHGGLVFFLDLDRDPAVDIGFTVAELALMGLIAWQLARRSFISYPSLAAFATRALWVLVPICLILALVTLWADPARVPDRHPLLQLTLAVARSIRTAILVFLLAIGGFAGWFPVRMKQNSARLLIGFLVIQAYQWTASLAANTRWQWTYWGNFWWFIVLSEVLVYWIVALNPAGEVAIASPVPRWEPERMEALTGQLEHIHSTLVRRGY